MTRLSRRSLATLLVLGACADPSTSRVAPTEPSLAISAQLYDKSRKMVAAMVIPAVLDSKGNVTKAPVGLVFRLGGSGASAFFTAIAGRTRAQATNGQFYSPPSTDKAYANTQKLLAKLASQADAVTTTTASGASVTVATVTPSTWWSATGGKPPVTAATFGKGTTPNATNAKIYYKDANGTVWPVFMTFAYKTTQIAAAPRTIDGAEGSVVPWADIMHEQLLALRESARLARAAAVARELLVPTFLWPTVAQAQVATNEAMPADGEFKVVNGSTAGTGKRWQSTCVPGADFPSGAFDVPSEIPGMTSTVVGGKTLIAFSSVMADETYAYCSL
jgi:hypothetical protein